MASRQIDITEHAEIPWLSVLLGYGPMAPMVGGAVGAWIWRGDWRSLVVDLTVVYAASIIAFLAGVTRGLSFRTEGGPRLSQITIMLGLHILALAGLVAIMLHAEIVATSLAIVGFSAVAIIDPLAAKGGTAPLFFARLRPTQMPIAIISLAAVLCSVLIGR